jgi:hypothetical protein
MQESKRIKVLAVSGLARAGKNTFCDIAQKILESNGYRVKQFSFAKQLKREVAPFLRDVCGVDVYTTDSELKKDFRDFLVWYGTTWWRKRDPQRWIRYVDLDMKSSKDNIDFALSTDIRYLNEGEWVHSWEGYLVHVAAYKMISCYTPDCDEHPELDVEEHPEDYFNDHPDWFIETQKREFFKAPNEQERINDPIVKKMADYKLEWEAKGLTPEKAVSNKELQIEVLEALNSMEWFTDALTLKELHPDKS